ncbi:hypothetical protein [Tenacibaculum aestuariivivum]|uniref:hypothetical protein n=1 Tax=Tenacibaculum aestuariivivum TaxID=2006131 RepID=UPI003AB607EF
MKKIIIVLVLALSFTLTTQAQKEIRNNLQKLSTEQQTELEVKKLTLKLDLSISQQKQITPLLAEKIQKRKKRYEKRKAIRGSEKKREELSANEIFNKKKEYLDDQIYFNTEMKRILDKQQYDRFQKISNRKTHKTKKKGTDCMYKENKKESRRRSNRGV